MPHFGGWQRGVARAALSRFVELFEAFPGHEDFTSDFKRVGPSGSFGQHEGDRAYGAHIGCDIIAEGAVASRDSSDQSAFFINERYAQPVKFQFTANLKGFAAQSLLYAAIKSLDIAAIIGVAEREHRIAVRHLFKLMAQIAPHTLRGRIGIKKFGMMAFEFGQFGQQTVKLAV